LIQLNARHHPAPSISYSIGPLRTTLRGRIDAGDAAATRAEPMNAILLAFLGSLALAGFHAFVSVLNRIPERHQAALDSIAGGVALAYVFLYLLFELVRDGAPPIHDLLPLGPEPVESLAVILAASIAGASSLTISSPVRALSKRPAGGR
jgi:hypothetical protein